MSRLQLLLPLLIWASWLKGNAPDAPPAPLLDPWTGVPLFGCGFLVLLLVMLLWARRIARRIGAFGSGRRVRPFQRAMGVGRLLIIVWFAAGLFVFGWGQVVLPITKPFNLPIDAPAALVAVLPALAAWMALWLVQFPVDRAIREQNLLIRLDDDLPVHAPPSFGQYFMGQFRLQMLLTLVPVLLVLAIEDTGVALISVLFHEPSDDLRLVVTFVAIGLIFLLSPLVLSRVLPTETLPAGPLRSRLEATCRRLNLGYRDILIWRTHFTLVNAAVMGVVPQVRYILLSDLLLETMDDRQVEAVFAHEVGHVVHRHMAWYVLFIVVFMLAAQGLGDALTPFAEAARFPAWLPWDLVAGLVTMAGFVLVFGSLSRRFERQADVFAARSLAPELVPVHPRERHVDDYGAELFNSALTRLARVNNIPLGLIDRGGPTGRAATFRRSVHGFRQKTANWWHGSIQSRMAYLRGLSTHPDHTSRFDRQMCGIRLALVCAFCAGVAWVTVSLVGGG